MRSAFAPYDPAVLASTCVLRRQPEIEKMQAELMQTDLVQIVKPQRLAFKRLPNGPTKANKGGL